MEYDLLYRIYKMVKKYFDRAEELMQLSNLCENDEVANILKSSASQIYELAQSNGAILKSASSDQDQD